MPLFLGRCARSDRGICVLLAILLRCLHHLANPECSMRILLLGLTFMIGLTGCQDPSAPTVSVSLQGKWLVTAFTEDGADILRIDDITSFELDFTDEDAGQGRFTWALTADRQPYVLTGEYDIDEASEQVALRFDNGPDQWELYVENPSSQRLAFAYTDPASGQLTLSGDVNGFAWVIASRRN